MHRSLSPYQDSGKHPNWHTQDLAETWLPGVVGRFCGAYPDVQIQVEVDRSSIMHRHLAEGKLDLMLTYCTDNRTHAQILRVHDLNWIAGVDVSFEPELPLPLVLLSPHCIFRDAALDGVQRPYREAFVSSIVAGLWAAVRAGLGITLRIAELAPRDLGLADMVNVPVSPPQSALTLQTNTNSLNPAAEHLIRVIRESAML